MNNYDKALQEAGYCIHLEHCDICDKGLMTFQGISSHYDMHKRKGKMASKAASEQEGA